MHLFVETGKVRQFTDSSIYPQKDEEEYAGIDEMLFYYFRRLDHEIKVDEAQ
jgi:hypothetical protein